METNVFLLLPTELWFLQTHVFGRTKWKFAFQCRRDSHNNPWMKTGQSPSLQKCRPSIMVAQSTVFFFSFLLSSTKHIRSCDVRQEAMVGCRTALSQSISYCVNSNAPPTCTILMKCVAKAPVTSLFHHSQLVCRLKNEWPFGTQSIIVELATWHT